MLARQFPRIICLRSTVIPAHTPAFSSAFSTTPLTRNGSKPEDHVTRSNDSHNVQKDAAESGKADRAKSGSNSQAISESDHGNSNAKAKRDHPEAPGPVLGMNDERGAKGH